MSAFPNPILEGWSATGISVLPGSQRFDLGSHLFCLVGWKTWLGWTPGGPDLGCYLSQKDAFLSER